MTEETFLTTEEVLDYLQVNVRTIYRRPGVGGLSVIREARRLVSGLPVVIVTGRSTETSAIEAVNLGVSAYLTKPFRMGNIMAAAARALGDSEPTLPAES